MGTGALRDWGVIVRLPGESHTGVSFEEVNGSEVSCYWGGHCFPFTWLDFSRPHALLRSTRIRKKIFSRGGFEGTEDLSNIER